MWQTSGVKDRRQMPTIERVKIGKNLRRVRDSRLMTQQELADKSGLGLRTIVRIESDKVEPRYSTIKSLAAALEVEPRELVEPKV
jgi:transcriptional regulator with XRE-family HTH domain